MSKYATPGAFRTALTDKLRNLAEQGPWNLQQLLRQFAYDRLLERLYMLDGEWIVKGAVALLARDIGVRSSLDIDLYRAKAADAAEQDLRTAASRDIGDRFRFEIGPREPVSDDSKAVRFKVDAYIGNQRWERFPIDLVGSDLRMTGEPDDVPARRGVALPLTFDVPNHARWEPEYAAEARRRGRSSPMQRRWTRLCRSFGRSWTR